METALVAEAKAPRNRFVFVCTALTAMGIVAVAVIGITHFGATQSVVALDNKGPICSKLGLLTTIAKYASMECGASLTKKLLKVADLPESELCTCYLAFPQSVADEHDCYVFEEDDITIKETYERCKQSAKSTEEKAAAATGSEWSGLFPECYGGDIHEVDGVKTLEACRQGCAQYSGCKFITFGGGSYPRCIYKNCKTSPYGCSPNSNDGFCGNAGAGSCDPAKKFCGSNYNAWDAKSTEGTAAAATERVELPRASKWSGLFPECYGGDIYETNDVSTLDACQKGCAQYSGCKFITFGATAYGGRCIYKNCETFGCTGGSNDGFCGNTGSCDPVTEYCGSNYHA